MARRKRADGSEPVETKPICWRISRVVLERLEEAKWKLRLPKQQIAERAITVYLDSLGQ